MNAHRVFFTSDTHFFHKLMLEKRNFADYNQMHEYMIEVWNRTVPFKDAHVYHHGDVAFGDPHKVRKILDRLHGNIYLLRGNHEKTAEQKACAGRFAWIKDVYKLKLPIDFDCEFSRSFNNRIFIWMSHYAHRTWPHSHKGSLHTYGHSHGNLPDDPYQLSLDVGFDADLRSGGSGAPVSLMSIISHMQQKRWLRPQDRRDELPPLQKE